MDASDKLGLSLFEAIGRLGSGNPDICGGAADILVHECGSGISIVHAIVRDISDMSGIFGICDILDAFDISDGRRVSDSTAFKPPTSIIGAAFPAEGICVGAGAGGGLDGIDCDDGWLLF